MKNLFIAIRTQLTDATLNAIVPLADITSSYNAQAAAYPCITLEISDGGAGLEISGVLRARLEIDAYSKLNEEELHTILERVRDLLHSQERAITDANTFVHVIYESKIEYGRYDVVGRIWRARATYEVLYATSNLILITATSGAIYADDSDVTAVSGKEIAKFQGAISLDVAFTGKSQTESNRFAKAKWYSQGIALLTMEEVIFKAASLNKLWTIGYNASDTLADGATAATSYTVQQSSYPTYLQVLFQCVKSDDGKKLEIEADKAVCESFQIPFSTKELAIHRCRWSLLGDSSDNVVKVVVEN